MTRFGSHCDEETFRQALKSFSNVLGKDSKRKKKKKSLLVLSLSGTTSILHLCKSTIAVPSIWCLRLNQSRFAVIYKPEWRTQRVEPGPLTQIQPAVAVWAVCVQGMCLHNAHLDSFFHSTLRVLRKVWKHAVRIIFYLLISFSRHVYLF